MASGNSTPSGLTDGLSLSIRRKARLGVLHIHAFSRTHWERQPWVKDVASRMRERLTI